jgi:hypothetical protein
MRIVVHWRMWMMVSIGVMLVRMSMTGGMGMRMCAVSMIVRVPMISRRTV